MSTLGSVQVGDVGTTYKAHLLNAGAEFDPSSADTLQLIFKTPKLTLTRSATVLLEDSQFFLTYTVVAADVAAGLHAVTGTYLWQAYLHFPDGTRYHTNVESYVVKKNIIPQT